MDRIILTSEVYSWGTGYSGVKIQQKNLDVMGIGQTSPLGKKVCFRSDGETRIHLFDYPLENSVVEKWT